MLSSNVIRLALVDDHRAVHEMVTKVLSTVNDIKLVAQGHNGSDSIRLCEDVRPDVLLMDVVMPIMDGAEATRLVHANYPDVRILVLSSFEDGQIVRTMLTNGAVGYILKHSLSADLVDTVRMAFKGNVVLSPEAADNFIHLSTEESDFRLSGRERETLTLMAQGLNNYEIANRLVISRSTVKFHIANILLKMGVETRAEAIVLAAKHNLI